MAETLKTQTSLQIQTDSIHTFCSIPVILFGDSEVPDQTEWMCRVIWAFSLHMPLRHVFAWRGQFIRTSTVDTSLHRVILVANVE